MIAYRYDYHPGIPLDICPECGYDLASENGIVVALAVGPGAIVEYPTNLQPSGRLADPHGDIAKGLHSETLCGGCRTSLIDYEVREDSDD